MGATESAKLMEQHADHDHVPPSGAGTFYKSHTQSFQIYNKSISQNIYIFSIN